MKKKCDNKSLLKRRQDRYCGCFFMKKIVSIISILLLSLSAFAAKSKWFKAQTKVAPVKSISATSELVEAQFEGRFLYPPVNILDGEFKTTWCEAEENGSGIGESITLEFSEPVSFDEIQIVNGFASKDYYMQNNRVKTLQITQVAKEHFQQKNYELKDNTQEFQSIKFELCQTAQTITLKIVDVYKGEKFDDTCLSDIKLLYKGKVIPFTNVENIKKIQEENSRLILNKSKGSFEKDFTSLFGSEDVLWFLGENNACLRIDGMRDNNHLRIKDLYDDYNWRICKSGTKEELINFVKENYSDGLDEEFIYRIERMSDSDFEKVKKSDYVAFIFYEYYRRPRFSLYDYKIKKSQMVGYVETDTYIIVKLDGKNVYFNGEKYIPLTDKKVYVFELAY